MSRKTWTFNKQWRITAELSTASPLHIGNGDTIQHPFDKEHENVNACIKDAQGKPYIPGTTLKGKLRAWLETELGVAHQNTINDLFGYLGENHASVQGGKAECHDALLKTEFVGDGSNYPCWQAQTQTYIETSVAIDRDTRTAAHRKLFHTETVPPGVGFGAVITGALSNQEAALIIYALNAFQEPETAATFGAEDTAGKGRMELFGRVEVFALSKEEVKNWLGPKELPCLKSKFIKQDNGKLLQKHLPEPLKTNQSAQGNQQKLHVTIQMDGPFLINNPYANQGKANKSEGNTHQNPLLDNQGRPLLSGKSLRGALRTQAERILRTLGADCCNTTNPCKAIAELSQVKTTLCPACQVFGAGGWRSPLRINPFTYQGEYRPTIPQEFVAIDRFHGGGKDSAKFNASYYERPKFQGTIEFGGRLPAWGKGLLALVLRDLEEGDIKLGFGANKGYGGIESVAFNLDGLPVNSLENLFTTADLNAFWVKFCQALPSAATHSENLPSEVTAIGTASAEAVQVPPNSADPHPFLNPYQFVPAIEPNATNWLAKEELTSGGHHHSHARYHQYDKGQPVYHGRLHCKLATETPIFIGSKRKEGTAPIKVENYKLNGGLAIPATSLRGLISSLAETASNSAMRVLDDGLLSYRKTTDTKAPKDRPLSDIGLVVVEAGSYKLIPMSQKWPLKNVYANPPGEAAAFLETNQANTWSPDKPRIFYIEIDEESKSPIGLPIPSEGLPEFRRRKMQPCILRILGKTHREEDIPDTKQHEMLLGVNEDFVEDFDSYCKRTPNKLPIIPLAVERFEQLANQRAEAQKSKDLEHDAQRLPYHPQGTARNDDSEKYGNKLRLKTGDLVYYRLADSKKSVAEISFSAIWRGRVENKLQQAAKVHQFFPPELLPFNPSRTKLSPAELLFGFVEDLGRNNNIDHYQTLNFAGKVRISAGCLVAGQDKTNILQNPVTLKILSSPKLPSPALYFRPKQQTACTSGYIPKPELDPEDHQANGRKYYLHALRQQNNPDQVQQLTVTGAIGTGGTACYPWASGIPDNPEQKATVTPIKPGTAFEFTVDFDNLNEEELGLLCYVLKPTPNFRHKIGMGKPIGLGSVNINIESLELIGRLTRYGKDNLDAQRYNIDKSIHFTDTLRESFRNSMDSSLRHALEMLGDPCQVTLPVHYPQVRGENLEKETYRWFVANDLGSGSERRRNKIKAQTQPLAPINGDTRELPTLNRHDWAGDRE